MSKKCCGLTYFDDELVCSICGKSLQSLNQEEVVEEMTESKEEDSHREALAEESEASDSTKQHTDDEHSFSIDSKREVEMNQLAKIVFDDVPEEKSQKGRASAGFKAVGIISLIMSIAGLALIGVFVWFMIISPNYDKTKEGYEPTDSIPYSHLATASDSEYEMSEPLEMTATQTDAASSDAESVLE
ncbi:MAG: hypothetical protein E7258_06295 [Lachnospiraceae bacterium]|nr:hypothetical protein [Lachnospiraceae bacterium]